MYVYIYSAHYSVTSGTFILHMYIVYRSQVTCRFIVYVHIFWCVFNWLVKPDVS